MVEGWDQCEGCLPVFIIKADVVIALDDIVTGSGVEQADYTSIIIEITVLPLKDGTISIIIDEVDLSLPSFIVIVAMRIASLKQDHSIMNSDFKAFWFQSIQTFKRNHLLFRRLFNSSNPNQHSKTIKKYITIAINLKTVASLEDVGKLLGNIKLTIEPA